MQKTRNFIRDDILFHFWNQEDFIETLHTFYADREIITVPTNCLQFARMPTPIELTSFVDDNPYLDKEVAYDAIHSDLDYYLSINACEETEELPVAFLRPCAVPSLLDRLKVHGAIFDLIPTDILTEHFCTYAEYAKGKTQLVFGNGKINACVSPRYTPVPAEELMETAALHLTNAGGKFHSGFLTHTVTGALWDMGNTTISLPFDGESSNVELFKVMEISTSDTGESSVNITPLMRDPKQDYALSYSLPVRMPHIGSASMEQFAEKLEMIENSAYQDALDTIFKLSGIQLQYPANTLLWLCKWLSIPEKYGASVYEEYRQRWQGEGKTAYEVYTALSDVLRTVMADTDSQARVQEYRERIARGTHFRFAEHDVPGEYDYKDKIIGVKGA